jgi:misacylated tRNA(Ala) deacylase
MTEILYMPDLENCYIKEFPAEVIAGDEEEGWVILDRTAFYPEGGGQPSDTGELYWDDKKTKVVHVKKGNRVKHYLQGEIPKIGTTVLGILDWERRYAHMRMHTAQHLLSAVVWKRFKAATVGNQIHADHSHIDFQPASFTMDELGPVQEEVNSIIEQSHDIRLKFMLKKDIEEIVENERVDLSRLPSSVKDLRTILIGNGGNIDTCPCAGTHVRSLKEIGRMNITKRKSKGSGKVRINYELTR